MDCVFAAHIKAKQIIPRHPRTHRLYQKTRLWSVCRASVRLCVHALDGVHILCSQNTQTTAFSLEIIWACRQKGFNSVSVVIYFVPTPSLSLNSVFQISLLQKSPSFLICLSWCASHFLNPTVFLSLNGLAKGVCMQRRVSQTSLILIYSYPSVRLSSSLLAFFIVRL